MSQSKPSFLNHSHAVSEVVGGIMLLVIAVLAFSAIYSFVIPLPGADSHIHAKLIGYVQIDGGIQLEHIGGNSLTDYRIDVREMDGTLLGSTSYTDIWSIGGIRNPTTTKLTSPSDKLYIGVYAQNNDGNEETVFDGILCGVSILDVFDYCKEIMLISSLRTNTSDEDLICYSHLINSTIEPTTYIFEWMVNNAPYADMLIPFDTNNSTIAKDYINNFNGTIIGPSWTSEGIKGGAYQFDGGGDYIHFDMMPIFENISTNDFTLSIWINSLDMFQDHRTLLQIRGIDQKNFISVFTQGEQLHFGVCENGVKQCVRTEKLSNNTWYHIACVWNASDKYSAIYVNGIKSTLIGDRNYPFGAHSGIEIGCGTASSRFWYGRIDEMQLFNRILSDEQIDQLYREQGVGLIGNAVIRSQETHLGDIWQYVIIPNNSLIDDIPVESNMLRIIAYDGW